jgi:acyl dehydratase
VRLPDSTLHASEGLTFHAPVPAGATVVCEAKLTQRSQRSGWIVSVLDSEILLDGEPAVSARATVLSPQAGA